MFFWFQQNKTFSWGLKCMKKMVSKQTNKNQYWWTYLQGSNKDSDIENGFVDRDGEGEGGMNWENSTDIHCYM